MTALLELPAFRQQVHAISVEVYHRLGEMSLLSEDVELLRGIVVTKMPKPPRHKLVAQKLMRQLLQKVPNGYEVRREGPLTLRDSEPEPDLSLVRGTPDDWAIAHPSTADWVVEVAVTSAALDEGKAEIYAEAGILEYWVVLPEDRVINVIETRPVRHIVQKSPTPSRQSFSASPCLEFSFRSRKSFLQNDWLGKSPVRFP